jgi:hypothetical protein
MDDDQTVPRDDLEEDDDEDDDDEADDETIVASPASADATAPSLAAQM